ncbi:MAG TPA: hypothetical protein VIV60_24565 [Polyangiaceae bacterium]
MSLRPRLECCLLAAALALTARSVVALPRARLVYVRSEGAEGCPESMELRLAVLHRLGYNPFEPNAQESIVVVIRQRDATLQASVDRIDDQGLSRGSRLLEAPANQCDELIAAAALSISLAIDPERALSNPDLSTKAGAEPPPTTAPVVTEPTPEVQPADELAAPVPASVKRTRIIPDLSFSLHGSSLALVVPAFGASLGMGLQRGLLSLSLEGRLDPPTTRSINDRGGRLTIWLVMGTLLPCLRPTPLRICGLISYGSLRASTTGVAQPAHDHASYVAMGVRLGVARQVLPRVSLGMHIDVLAALATYEAKFGDSTVWEPRRLSGLFGLDGAWDFE